MSERKAINKYYPPDYNPLEAENALKKVSKKLKTKNKDSITIRLMTPFSIRCLKCSEYISKSRKFNGKKELLPEKYLDTVKIYRLSIKCPRCNNMISFRTDPKTADYVMECGGARNYTKSVDSKSIEDVDETLERLLKEQKESENAKTKGGNNGEDKMELLEQRLAKLQKEQEDDEELEKIRRLKMHRMEQEKKLRSNFDDEREEDEYLDQLAEEAFKDRKSNVPPSSTPTPKVLKIMKKTKKRNPLGVAIRRK